MKTAFRHNNKYNFVELEHPFTDNVTYINRVHYGYSYEGLQTTVTGYKNGIWQIATISYTKTLGQALNKLQRERLKSVAGLDDMYQSSTSLWK